MSKRVSIALPALCGLCLAALAHGAWLYPEADSDTGALRPSALEARIAAAQAGGTNALAQAQAYADAIAAQMTNYADALIVGFAPTGTVASAGTVTGAQSNTIDTALQPSWATTGTVSRAQMADMLRSPSGRTWLEVANGNTYIVEVTNSVDVYVVSTSGEGYNGPAAGTVFSFVSWAADPLGLALWESASYDVTTIDPFPNYGFFTVVEHGGGVALYENESSTDPTAGSYVANSGVGSLVIDWVPITNVYQVATQQGTVILIGGHDADPDAHPTLARASDLAGYVATNHTGNVTVDGTVTATAFVGDGSALTGLPVPSHNSLTGIQGGGGDPFEAWHLTQSDHVAMTNMIATGGTPLGPTWFRVPTGDWRTSAGAVAALSWSSANIPMGFLAPSNTASEIRWQGSCVDCSGWTGIVMRARIAAFGATAGNSVWGHRLFTIGSDLTTASTSTDYRTYAAPATGLFDVVSTNIIDNATGVWGGQLVRRDVAGGDSLDAMRVMSIEYMPLMP